MNSEKPTKRPFAIHPYALALFPILSLYSTNVGEVALNELPLPVILALVGTMLAHAGLYAILRDPLKRAFAVSILWLGFYTIIPVIDALRATLNLESSSNAFQFAFVALLGLIQFVAFLAWLRETPRSFAALTTFLNTLTLIAVLLAVSLTGYRSYFLWAPGTSTEVAPSNADPATYPDIYFLLYDAYTRADYLRDAFDYNNAPFLDALRERGFYIADQSRSNYIFTQMSLAGTLNYTYLEDDLLDRASENWNAAVPRLAGRIRNNAAVAFLRARGYAIVTFPSYVAATQLPNPDFHMQPIRSRGLTEFQFTLMHRNPLRSLWYRLNKSPRIFPYFFPLDVIEHFEPRDHRPMFVFAHIMAPHLPHTVDAEGNHYATPPTYKDGYRNEVTYLNKRTLEVVDAVLARNPNSAFIIQGDHGPWSDWDGNAEGRQDPWRGSPEDYLRDRTAILNALYLPSRDYADLYPAITPVNTFPVLFNDVFGADLPLRRDKSYLYTEDGTTYQVIQDE